MDDLRIGMGVGFGGEAGLDGLLQGFKQAEAAGFQTAWCPNIFSCDALTLIALAGRETSRIELGTAVVPTHSRHPLYMAQQALTTQVACDGRLALGIGPSHKVVIENMLGLSYDKPALHVREYVRILKDVIDTGKTSFEGRTYRVNGAVNVPGASSCPVLIGGLGPIMRRVAGAVAGGTVTWMTGPRTLGEAISPDVRAAAKEAGRPEPRVVASFPIVITNDPAGARKAASQAFAMYGQLPSYRAMLDAEGLTEPGEITIAGNEKDIEDSLRGLVSAGVTDFNATIFPYGDDPGAAARRTYQLLSELAR